MKKNGQALFQLASTALQKAGAHSKMAEAAARHLVQAEAQGLPTGTAKPTTDPKEAIEHGSLFPIGGVKGANARADLRAP
jgi:LDH2 family malate/lactate/ureidoglycolate dehydrogenase